MTSIDAQVIEFLPLSFSIIHSFSIFEGKKRASMCRSLSDRLFLCSCHILFMTNLGNLQTVEVSTRVFDSSDIQRFWQLFASGMLVKIFPKAKMSKISEEKKVNG